jgi:rare lipoprotein A
MSAIVKVIRLGIAASLLAIGVATPMCALAANTPQTGTATFYNDKFQGKKTSSGEVYDGAGLTASHKSLPYGTKVKVTNLANNQSVVVTVNDRMAKSSKVVIEVSKHAAEELGFTKSGKAKVKLEVQ